MRQSAKIILFFILAYGLVYGSAVIFEYAFTDDTFVLWAVDYEGLPLFRNYVSQGGRPLYGLLLNGFFSLVDGIGSLRWLRLLSIVGIVAFGLAACSTYRRAGNTVLQSCFLALLISLTPTFAVYAGWAVCFSYAFAAAMAWLAGDRVAAMFFGEKVHFSAGALIGWNLLLVAVLSIYQPVGGFYLLPTVIYATGKDRRQPGLRPWFCVLGSYLLVAIVYFALYKASLHLWLGTGGSATRARVATDLFKQMQFLYETPLRYGCLMWSTFYGLIPQLAAGALTVGFLAFGIAMFIRREPRQRLVYPMLLGATALCSVAPMLITAEAGAPFRTLGVLSALYIHLFVRGMEECFSISRRGYLLRTLVLAILCTGGAAVTGYHLYDGLVCPQTKEIVLYRQFFRKTFAEYPKTITFVLPDYESVRFGRFPGIFEFGAISSQFSWVATPLIPLLLNEQFGLNKMNASREQLMRLSVVCIPSSAKIGVLNPPVVDGNLVLSGREAPVNIFGNGNPTNHPYFGELLVFGQGWCYSTWFGYFNIANYPHIVHMFLGELDCAGGGAGDYWFYTRKMGWFWTSPSSFPDVYSSMKSSWIRLHMSENSPYDPHATSLE